MPKPPKKKTPQPFNGRSDHHAARIAGAGIALARMLMAYFGDEQLDELLTSDIRLRDAAATLLRDAEHAERLRGFRFDDE